MAASLWKDEQLNQWTVDMIIDSFPVVTATEANVVAACLLKGCAVCLECIECVCYDRYLLVNAFQFHSVI